MLFGLCHSFVDLFLDLLSALLLAHIGQSEQAILLFDRSKVAHEVIEAAGPSLHFQVTGVGALHPLRGFFVVGLSLLIGGLFEMDVSELEVGFGALLRLRDVLSVHGLLKVLDSLFLVALGQFHLGKGKIDLVVIIDVLFVLEHIEELFPYSLRVPNPFSIGKGLFDLGLKGHLIRRVQAYHLGEITVPLLDVPDLMIELPQNEIQTLFAVPVEKPTFFLEGRFQFMGCF